METVEQPEYAEGFGARVLGQRRDDNPYRVAHHQGPVEAYSPNKYLRWDRGWMDAECRKATNG